MGYSTERKGSISGEEKASENGGQELLEYSIVHGGGLSFLCLEVIYSVFWKPKAPQCLL